MIRRLVYLSGLAILGVVLFHTAGMGFVAMFAWAPRYASPGGAQTAGAVAYYFLRSLEQAAVVGVPAFLCVSGFFVAIATGRTRRRPPGWRMRKPRSTASIRLPSSWPTWVIPRARLRETRL